MNPIVAQVCRDRTIDIADFRGGTRDSEVVEARCEAIFRLRKTGMTAAEIARETGLHVQTVYYWLRPKRRDAMIKKSALAFHIRRLGGRRLTKEQRQEILEAYLEDPAKGTAMACGRGLSPMYAYKLANAMGYETRPKQ
jgi:transposase-like protein